MDQPLPGNTPLDPDEMEGLIPSYVTTQGELNQVEQTNILEAVSWAAGRSHPNILMDSYLRQLHQRMFKDVWKWAGTYRKTLKNIGVDPQNILVEVHQLCGDTRYWIENKTYHWDELGCRFHHRLVTIHPFPNGNGRHARLATDLLMATNLQQSFTWGALSKTDSIGSAGTTRDRYLTALRAADKGQFDPLLAFVRS